MKVPLQKRDGSAVPYVPGWVRWTILAGSSRPCGANGDLTRSRLPQGLGRGQNAVAAHTFRTRTAKQIELALELVDSVRFGYVAVDGGYGKDPAFLRGDAFTVPDVHQRIWLDDRRWASAGAAAGDQTAPYGVVACFTGNAVWCRHVHPKMLRHTSFFAGRPRATAMATLGCLASPHGAGHGCHAVSAQGAPSATSRSTYALSAS